MNNTIIKILSLIAVICFSTTALMIAKAEDDGLTSSSIETTSSEQVSSVESQPVESEPETTSSEIVSSEEITSSEVIASSETVSITSSKTQTTVSKKTESKKTTSKKNTSSKKSSKKKSSKKSSTKDNDNGYTPNNYNNGYESISGEWEGGKDKEQVEETSSAKKLSKHITNPKKVVQRWIWLPVLIGLGCVGVLVYTNMYLFKNGKHTKVGVRTASFDYADEEPYKEEVEAEKEEHDDDPFSAENFFNFDDE